MASVHINADHTIADHTIADHTIARLVEAQQKNEAFADALVALFRAHPIPEWKHEMHHAVRRSALRKARAGDYCDHAPGGIQRWRKQVAENAELDWNVPADQVVAIHALIYG